MSMIPSTSRITHARAPRRLAAWAALALCASGLLATPARATVPSETSYQGVLTDDAGNLVPDGSYALAFRIYDVPVDGIPLWSETHAAVAVSKGGFAVRLGVITPIGIAFDRPCWLSVSVNGGPELSPRVALTPSPQALSLRMPFRASESVFGYVLEVHNNSSAGGGLWVVPNVTVGSAGRDGSVGIYGPGSPFLSAMLTHTSGGGALYTTAPNGDPQAALYPITGGGCGLDLRGPGNTHQAYMQVDDQAMPSLVLNAFSQYAALDMSLSGSPSVDLPENAVESYEIVDEPGIAQAHVAGAILLPPSGTFGDLMSVTITTPDWGYITVHADGMHGIGANGAAVNEANFTIKETPGGAIDPAHWLVSGFTSAMPAGLTRLAFSLRRTWYKPPGTYTFYFQGQANNPAELANYLWDPTLSANYTPASYGTVQTTATAAAAARAGLTARTARATDGPGGERLGADVATVDLRELEQRARTLKLEARAAERALRAARHAAAAPKRPVRKVLAEGR